MSQSTKEKFNHYFDQNMGPAEAKRLHESKLQMEPDSRKKLADTSINPTFRQVTYLQELWRDEHFGKDWADDPMSKLKDILEDYKEQGRLTCLVQ